MRSGFGFGFDGSKCSTSSLNLTLDLVVGSAFVMNAYFMIRFGKPGF